MSSRSWRGFVTTTASYDDLGRLTTLNDPDRGSHAYTYDGDGHLLSDVSGTRTLGSSYDLLGRLGCEQDAIPTINATGACSSGAHPFIQNTYDTTFVGTQGTSDFPIGQLTKSMATTYFPDGSSATTTDLYQHDQRGRLVTQQLQFGLPSGWNVTQAFPTYQVAESYNDANQVTTTTTSTNPSGQGYTSTQLYDTTTGVLTGAGNGSATLATLVYNSRAQLDTLNFLTSTGSALLADQFSYDANLRPTDLTASWQSGSGNTGTVMSQARSYDPASNVISLATTLAAVPGVSGSGGSEAQNFCYDEQNRLVWAGNSGTQPGAGNGTCGSLTLANSLNGGAYSNGFVYTHLGQLWKAPVNGSGPKQLYLYCTASAPHHLTGIYPIGTTCSNPTGAVYTSSYDAWGNVTSRSYSSTTATLSYDALDHFTQWYVSSTNQEQYLYDASGQRVLRRSTNGTGTTLTVYAFGLEDHVYSGSGANQSNTYYYSLAGRLLGALDSNGTVFYLTDALGSVLGSFSNVANGAAVKGNQVFGPYGKARYTKGTINTAKGFTGQYNDSLTGLDYYNSRYYDPVAGVFLSADTAQGNLQGMNPYAYVGGNPETMSDPSGRYIGTVTPITQKGGAIAYINPVTGASMTIVNDGYSVTSVNGQPSSNRSGLDVTIYTYGPTDPSNANYDPNTDATNSPWAKFSQTIGLTDLQNTWSDPNATFWDKLLALAKFGWTNANNVFQLAMIFGFPEGEGAVAAGEEGSSLLSRFAEGCGALSFAPTTPIATEHGKQAIGILHIGDKVWAYNPKSHSMELEPILHVWINHDNDLVDLTLTSKIHLPHSGVLTRKSEVIHTNKKHPFLTREKGFAPVSQITLGMHVLRADGTYGVVTGWKVVPGVKAMYNLEVAHDHTFTVGTGQWVVHNCAAPLSKFIDGARMTVNDALGAAQEFLGEGYSEAGPGRFVSQDGLRQFRMTDSDLGGWHSPWVPHMNFEEFVTDPLRPGRMIIIQNIHIILIDP